MARLVPGLARVVGVDTGQLYSLARDAEGGVLGVQGLLIRAALRTWLPPAALDWLLFPVLHLTRSVSSGSKYREVLGICFWTGSFLLGRV